MPLKMISLPLTYSPYALYLTSRIVPCEGNEKSKTRPTDSGQAMSNIHIPGGRSAYVDSMERTEGIHGHVVGLRQIPCHRLCSSQFNRAARRLRHGYYPLQGAHRVRRTLFHRRASSILHLIILLV